MKSCWTWKGANSRQEKNERWLWSWIRRKPSSGSVFQLCVGLDDAFQVPKETVAGVMRAPRAPAACSV